MTFPEDPAWLREVYRRARERAAKLSTPRLKQWKRAMYKNEKTSDGWATADISAWRRQINAIRNELRSRGEG